MAANQIEFSQFKYSVIKFLAAEKCKPCEIYRRISNGYREARFREKKTFTNGLNMDLPLQIEQRSVIKSLVDEKCKPCEIYRRMCDVYGEACFSQKMFRFGLVSLFNGISTFVGYLMPKPFS